MLRDRRQCVSVREAVSSWRPVISGVPQGSVLGPLLFVMYIDDIDNVLLSSSILKFADDTKMFVKFDPNSFPNPSSFSPLNEDLHRLSRWCNEWCLKLNMSKCVCVHFGSNNPRLSVSISTTPTTCVDHVMDLGVWVSEDLKTSSHCLKAASKAQRVLSMIKLSFKYLDSPILVRLYKSFVRPHLEYCSSAWCPFLVKDVNVLEKVQRRMTRQIPGLKDFSYDDRLKQLQLLSLKKRRLRYDLLLTYKLLNNLTDIDPSFFFNTCTETRTRGDDKIFVKFCRLDIRKFFFSQRVTPIWNSLPSEVKSVTSFSLFKKRLDCYLASHDP